MRERGGGEEELRSVTVHQDIQAHVATSRHSKQERERQTEDREDKKQEESGCSGGVCLQSEKAKKQIRWIRVDSEQVDQEE